MEIFRRYIPTVSSTDVGHRYIPTDFETELCPSVIIIDRNIPSVIPLVFSGFLVVSVVKEFIYEPCMRAYAGLRSTGYWSTNILSK
jgi:hypothetical protein